MADRPSDSHLADAFLQAMRDNDSFSLQQLLRDAELGRLALLSDMNGHFLVWIAIEKGFPEIAKRMLELIDSDIRADKLVTPDFLGYTLIELAAMNGCLSIIEPHLRLLSDEQRGIISENLGWRLHEFATEGCREKVKNLIKVPTENEFHHVQKRGKLALCAAALKGQVRIVDDLLEVMVGDLCEDIHSRYQNPLYLLIASGKDAPQTAKMLMERQESLLQFVSKCNNRYFKFPRVGYDFNEPNETQGDTLLHIATRKRKINLALSILKFRPALSRKVNNAKNTVLHLAARRGLHEVVRALVNLRPSLPINAKNGDNQTALDVCFLRSTSDHMFTDSPTIVDPQLLITRCILLEVGAHKPHRFIFLALCDEQMIKDQTNTVLILSILIVMLAFTALLTVPGGFRPIYK